MYKRPKTLHSSDLQLDTVDSNGRPSLDKMDTEQIADRMPRTEEDAIDPALRSLVLDKFWAMVRAKQSSADIAEFFGIPESVVEELRNA